MSTADLLRRAADLVEQRADDAGPGWNVYPEGGIQTATFAWIALLDPGIGSPLAAWLRGAADAAVSYPFTDGVHGRIMRSDGHPAAYRHTAEFIDGAARLARVILGEQS